MCDDDNMTFVIITTMYVIARPSSLVTIIIITSKTVWCDKRVVIKLPSKVLHQIHIEINVYFMQDFWR